MSGSVMSARVRLSLITPNNVHYLTTGLDAVSVLGTGNALIEGGGAQNAKDKVVQHNGKGTVTIKK